MTRVDSASHFAHRRQVEAVNIAIPEFPAGA